GVFAIVVAAGRGQRFGSAVPKQYLPLAGKPVLRHSLDALIDHRKVEAVLVVIDPMDRALYEDAAAGLDLLEPVPGGATRQESVRNGLESLVARNPDFVLIHDGARPMLEAGLIDRTLAALDEAEGVVAAIPLSDTVKRAIGSRVTETISRDGL